MPREKSTPLPQPVFNEGNVTPDPKRFKVKHPSNNQQYKAIENLLTKDVVSFERSRAQPGLEPTKPAVQAQSLLLNHYDDQNFGYLRISVDDATLSIAFHQVGQGNIPQSRADVVSVDLASRTIVAS